jgi:ABC-type uncharacterized transport system ATPase subunit
MSYDSIQEEIQQLEHGYRLLMKLDVLKAICAISEIEFREHTQELREIMDQVGSENPFNALKWELNLLIT